MKGGVRLDKFAGVGLCNIIIIWLVISMLNLIAKTIVLKYEKIPDSVQEIVTASM